MRANRKNWHPDVLSRHFRDIAKAAGADLIDLSTHTGHKTAAMARCYTRPTAEQFERAAEKPNAHKNRMKTSDGTTEHLNF